MALALSPPRASFLAHAQAGWLAGWLAGWRAGWLAGWLELRRGPRVRVAVVDTSARLELNRKVPIQSREFSSL